MVRILANINGAAAVPLATAVLAVQQSGDSFTFPNDTAADHLFAHWRDGFLVEVTIRNDRGNRSARWTCAEPKIEDTRVTLDAKAVSP